MKIISYLTILVLSFSVSASEVYNCEFVGPNYNLIIDDNDLITLENNFKTYQCKKGYASLPGTSLELNVLNCISKYDKISFYYAQVHDDIILSKNFIPSKDIICKKI